MKLQAQTIHGGNPPARPCRVDSAVSGSARRAGYPPRPRNRRRFSGRAGRQGAKSPQPQTGWRSRQSRANPSLHPDSLTLRESTAKCPRTGLPRAGESGQFGPYGRLTGQVPSPSNRELRVTETQEIADELPGPLPPPAGPLEPFSASDGPAGADVPASALRGAPSGAPLDRRHPVQWRDGTRDQAPYRESGVGLASSALPFLRQRGLPLHHAG